MKTYLLKLLVIIAAFAPSSLPAQVNLVYNGSFEIDNSFSGWTWASGGLFMPGAPGSGIQCADGHNAIGLRWQATIYQDVATVVGQQYDFSFYLAAAGANGVPMNVVYLNPSFGSTSLGTLSFSGAGKSYQNMGWEKFDYVETATSTSSRITFFNPSVSSSDPSWPMVDNVWLTAVPEPSVTALLFLGGVLLLSRCRLTRPVIPATGSV
jgi:hypothetical protein